MKTEVALFSEDHPQTAECQRGNSNVQALEASANLIHLNDSWLVEVSSLKNPNIRLAGLHPKNSAHDFHTVFAD